MDPAGSEPMINQTLSTHANTLDQQGQMINTLSNNQQAITQQKAQLQALLQTIADSSHPPSSSVAPEPPPVSSPSPVREARIPNPDPFSGTSDNFRGFLLQCTLVFSQQSAMYSSDEAKIAFVLGFLRGRALEWAEAFLANQSPASMSFQNFLGHFKQVFETPERYHDTSCKLLGLRQDRRSVADYSVDFRILAMEAGWDTRALLEVFYNRLNDSIKDELLHYEKPASLDCLITFSIRIDNCLRERRSTRNYKSLPACPRPTPRPATPPSSLSPADFAAHALTPEEPMQLGRTLKGTDAVPPSLSSTDFFVSLSSGSWSRSVAALIDSGAEGNFINKELAIEAGPALIPLDPCLKVSAANGQPLTVIQHQTAPVNLSFSGNHHETLQFYVFQATSCQIILGRPWLCLHNPHIDWQSNCILSWSPYCHSTCLRSALPDLQTTSLPPNPPDISGVPPMYHDLAAVFIKQKASVLPSHRPYDIAIDLLPGANLPSSRLFSLSKPELRAMEQYIKESLAAGIIRPSSSPLAAGFFFVEKKDKTLHPCIDYRHLNNITIKTNTPCRC
uniref:Ty3 transposon capsid-like protein domain-containing protein n=1 Tax=Oryzias latipes TaxID=8090 RepID=A0A3B3I5Q0_ORYLA